MALCLNFSYAAEPVTKPAAPPPVPSWFHLLATESKFCALCEVRGGRFAIVRHYRGNRSLLNEFYCIQPEGQRCLLVYWYSDDREHVRSRAFVVKDNAVLVSEGDPSSGRVGAAKVPIATDRIPKLLLP
jgi:hypothetical protein